jgi:3-hydroxyisobutyrate dehydrogenase-like beta-hydroxyacid dehydrogenase
MQQPTSPQEPPLAAGVIGVGHLGEGIARSLVTAGHAVGFFDVRSEAGDALVELGARRAATLAELAARADVLLAVVVDDAQVREVAEGVAGAARPGLTLVVHSTVDPATVQEIAERLDALGVAVLDAPVSGNAAKAQAGVATIMVGGEQAVLERCRALFEVIADDIFHLGPLGAGSVAKLANQLMLYGNCLFVGQALALAQASGIDERAMLAIARTATADSYALRNWERFGEHFHELIAKDVGLALATAARTGADVEAARRAAG